MPRPLFVGTLPAPPFDSVSAAASGALAYVQGTAAGKGRLSLSIGQPVLLLKHVGAKSGVERETALAYATSC